MTTIRVNKKKINIKQNAQKVYPALEDLKVKPSGVEQTFKSEKYGYDNVVVEAVESEKLNIIPSLEEQNYVGVYGEVNVEPANEIYEKGSYEERVRFWDAFTTNQKRTDYSYGLYNWDANAFYPTCDIGGSNMSRTFYMFNNSKTPVDLIERCKECGVKLDFSRATSVSYCFGSTTGIRTIPTLDLSKMSTYSLEGFFNNSHNIRVIEKLIVTEKTKYNNNCFNCKALEEIRFEGVIGNDIWFNYCTLLSKDSLLSIINALQNFGTQEVEYDLTGYPVGDMTADRSKTGTYMIYNVGIDSTSGEGEVYAKNIDGTNEIGLYFHGGYASFGEEIINALKEGNYIYIESTFEDGYYNITKIILTDNKNISDKTYTCTLGTENLQKLTTSEKAIATGKGWTLA